MSSFAAALTTLAISLYCILGDYLLKRASQAEHPFWTWEFALGVAVFASSSVGWLAVLPSLKLASVGVVYGVSTVLFMTALGRLAFDERLDWRETAGVACGVASILLLARFAE